MVLQPGDYVKIKGERGIKSSGKINKIEITEKHGPVYEVIVNGSFRVFLPERLEPLTTLVFTKEGNKRRTRKRVTTTAADKPKRRKKLV